MAGGAEERRRKGASAVHTPMLASGMKSSLISEAGRERCMEAPGNELRPLTAKTGVRVP